MRSGIKAMLLVVVMLCASITTGRTQSAEEDIEVEQELRRLTKPTVETIQTTYGDIYSCVDYHQQPAFDNHLIRKHSFHPQMKPTEEIRSKRFTSNIRSDKIWVNGKGCPMGSVPSRQMAKDDLLKAKKAAQIYASDLNPQTAQSPGVHYAVLHTPRIGEEVKYYGAGMFSGCYNPKLNHPSQYSSNQVKIQRGQDRIIVGWTVNPTYRDFKTRLFIYTQANGRKCFNDHCGVFVHTNPAIPLDVVLEPVEDICMNPVSGNDFFISKDEKEGRWVMKIGGEEIGYWPSKVFKEMGEYATYIEWGGEVYSPTNIASPEMGSGIRVNDKAGQCCGLNTNLTLVNEDHKVIPAMSLAKFADINKFYQLRMVD